jgi:HlyD family secretion protein
MGSESLLAALPSSPQPPIGSPQPVPAPPPSPRSKGPIFFILILLVAGAAWYFRPQQEKAPRTALIPTAKAVRGSLTSARRVAGSITASRFATITVPILQAPDSGRGMTLTYLAASGSIVKKGDLLAEIDAQDMRDHLDDVEAQVIQADLDIKKRKTVLVAQMEAMRQRLRSARADMLKAREDLKALDVKSSISQEQLKLAAEEFKAAYDETAAEIPLTEERLQADMNIAMIGYEQMVRHRDRHRHDIERCRITSPIGGMAVLQTTNRNGELSQIQVGERVSPGQPFMRVMDPNSMLLDALMSQTEAEMVRVGQPATIHFDAFPEIVLPGKVRSVGALAFSGRRTNYYVRRVPVQVSITQIDQRVIPDLSASADIVTSAAEGLIVPREAVTEESGKSVVYVRQEAGFTAREVAIAGESNTQVAVSGGLHEGEEVALDPHSVIFP